MLASPGVDNGAILRDIVNIQQRFCSDMFAYTPEVVINLERITMKSMSKLKTTEELLWDVCA